jgi:hypothetical protein
MHQPAPEPECSLRSACQGPVAVLPGALSVHGLAAESPGHLAASSPSSALPAAAEARVHVTDLLPDTPPPRG